MQEFDAVAFAKSTRVEIVDRSKDELEFDLVGVDASFANALRRILLSEVSHPTFMQLNLSIGTACRYLRWQ